jgi:hypothetical protein
MLRIALLIAIATVGCTSFEFGSKESLRRDDRQTSKPESKPATKSPRTISVSAEESVSYESSTETEVNDNDSAEESNFDDSDSKRKKESCNVVACLDDGKWIEASAMVFIPACSGGDCVTCDEDGGIAAVDQKPIQTFSGFPKVIEVTHGGERFQVTTGKEIGSDECPAEIIVPKG